MKLREGSRVSARDDVADLVGGHGRSVAAVEPTESFLGEQAISFLLEPPRRGGGEASFTCHPPTLDDASVKEFSMVDLPADGFPTRPIRGSRGILEDGSR